MLSQPSFCRSLSPLLSLLSKDQSDIIVFFIPPISPACSFVLVSPSLTPTHTHKIKPLCTLYCHGVLLQLLGDGSDLLNSVLVSGEVALERLVLPHQGSDLHQGGRLVVLLGQQVLLT